jgi:hypothetical protein
MIDLIKGFFNFEKANTVAIGSIEPIAKEEVENLEIEEKDISEIKIVDVESVITDSIPDYLELIPSEKSIISQLEEPKFEDTSLGFIIENEVEKVYFYRDSHEAYKMNLATEFTIATPPMEISKEEYIEKYIFSMSKLF